MHLPSSLSPLLPHHMPGLPPLATIKPTSLSSPTVNGHQSHGTMPMLNLFVFSVSLWLQSAASIALGKLRQSPLCDTTLRPDASKKPHHSQTFPQLDSPHVASVIQQKLHLCHHLKHPTARQSRLKLTRTTRPCLRHFQLDWIWKKSCLTLQSVSLESGLRKSQMTVTSLFTEG